MKRTFGVALLWAAGLCPDLVNAQAAVPGGPPPPALAPAPAVAPAPAAAPPATAAPPAPAAAPTPPADPNPPEERKIWLRPDAGSSDGARDEDEGEDALPHRGLFARFTAGVGIGNVRGKLGPEPGFKPIDHLSHTAPVLGLAGQLGGGFENYALAGELLYETMITRVVEPSHVSFNLFGAGLTASAYFRNDWFVTAHLRYLLMVLWKAQIPCFWDRGDATAGPGIGLTFGKEWYGRRYRRDRYVRGQDGRGADSRYREYREHEQEYEEDESGIGLALQGNYASLSGNPQLDYLSVLVLLTLTHF